MVRLLTNKQPPMNSTSTVHDVGVGNPSIFHLETYMNSTEFVMANEHEWARMPGKYVSL